MFTILSRIVHYGFKNFWRNGWLSTATVAIMTLALLVFMSLIMFSVITDQAISSIQDKIDISVYFKTTTSEDQILNIKQSLESLAEVKSVEYVSRDRALEIFKENHKDDATISQAINELSSNPLQASLNIKARQPDQYAVIARYFSDSPNLNQYVDNISYFKNQVVIDRLNSIIRGVSRGGLALTVVLALLASLVIFNTIRLAIYSNREEIMVMRVVGASNLLVRGPFVVDGVLSGIVAAVISLLITVPLLFGVSPYVSVFIPGLNIFRYFYGNLFSLFIYQFIFGIGLGSISSFVAVRRYLKN